VKITLTSEESIRLEPTPGPMTIEAESADRLYSPFHMLASGLAFCSYSILASWASQAKIPADDLAIDVAWTFAEEPHRIGTIDIAFDWPSLPPARRAVARRVAALCPIHGTLTHAPAITIHAAGEVVAPAPMPTAGAAAAAAGHA
jgi:uncharacterized OsmC-like protein